MGRRGRNYVGDLVAAPDGTVWFADYDIVNAAHYIDQINQQGSTTQHQVSAPVGGPQPLVVGPDGGIWFAGQNAMGRIDETSGQVTYVPVPPPFKPLSIVVGPDKVLYFMNRSIAKIFRFSIPQGKLLSPIKMPGTYAAMTLGPDENLWLSDQFDNQIDVAVLRRMSTVPTSVTVAVMQSQVVTVSEKHLSKGAFTATSSNSSIATVAPGNGPDEFVVTGVSTGSCVVTISDAFGNSIPLPVTVN